MRCFFGLGKAFSGGPCPVRAGSLQLALQAAPGVGLGLHWPGELRGQAGLSRGSVGTPASEQKPARRLGSGGNGHGSCSEGREACAASSPTGPRAKRGSQNGAGFKWAPSEDPHSLGVLDGPVQGAEKRPALLHHAVEVGLVKEVTLGVAEVLGTEPGQGSQLVRGGPGAPVRPGVPCGWAGGLASPSPWLSPPAPHLRRYIFHGSGSFSGASAFAALPRKGEDSTLGLPSASVLMFNRLPRLGLP